MRNLTLLAALLLPSILLASPGGMIYRPFTGDSGSGGKQGLVPAPAAGDAAAGKFLKANGGWAAVPAGGITSINSDATITQTLSVGSAGSDFAIANDASGGHTFNLPSASTTARGLVSTGAQTFAGAKTFPAGIIGDVTGNASTATALAANPTDCSAGQFANAIAASGNLTCANPLSGTVWDISWNMEAPSDGIYTLMQKAPFAFTINTLDIVTDSGTTTAAVKINGTNVTGISGVSVSSTPATATASAANSVSVGDKVQFALSSSSSPLRLALTVKYTR